MLLLDETSFPKQGRHSVGVARQYCSALGKVANCQVALSSALRADGLTWPLAMELYLPKEWMDRQPADAWTYVSWGPGTKRPLAAHFFALWVRPKHARRECWLLCERRESGERKVYFSNLPASAWLEEVVA